MKSNVMEEVRRIFKPEFLNRIDEIIVFHALTKEHMKKIVGIMTKRTAAALPGTVGSGTEDYRRCKTIYCG